MKVRLTKKLADRIDGIYVGDRQVGDLLDLPADKARLLVAEDWATPAEPSLRIVSRRQAQPVMRPRVDELDDREQAS
jgi:hypothetical protein